MWNKRVPPERREVDLTEGKKTRSSGVGADETQNPQCELEGFGHGHDKRNDRTFCRFSPVNTAVYHVGKDDLLETLFLSENIPALLDMTREEYRKITEWDAMNFTLPGDRRGLQEATANCVRTGKPFDYYYRVFHKKKGFEWVHVHAHVCGNLDGRPLILALFANMTTEGGIYQQIINASDRKVFVIDRDNDDILYANEKAATDDVGSRKSLLDQKCYAFLHGFDAPCEDCF